MLHDLVVAGTGPVGATLALALADAGLDIVALDARPDGGTLRGDRSLALSHGARLILERLAIWPALSAAPGAVTTITTIDISQAGGFGVTTLDATDHHLPALGYVVAYRALQAALDAALARAGIAVRFGTNVAAVGGTPAYAAVTLDDGAMLTARLAAVADGTGARVAGIAREHRDYGQTALVAHVEADRPHGGCAYERFTAAGPMALLPEGTGFGLVWTMAPARAEEALHSTDADFLAALQRAFGRHAGQFLRVGARRSFPLRLEYARPVTAARVAVLGNAAQALHPVAGQGFNLGLRDAHELAQAIVDTPRVALGERAMLDAYARRRRADRTAGIAFTHGLVQLFGNDLPFVRWPRGVALALLDAVPPVKRAFARAMMFGLR